MRHHLQKKLDKLDTMLAENEISQKIYDRALALEKIYSPYIFKRNAKEKIIGIVDIFGEMAKENKASRKKISNTEK